MLNAEPVVVPIRCKVDSEGWHRRALAFRLRKTAVGTALETVAEITAEIADKAIAEVEIVDVDGTAAAVVRAAAVVTAVGAGAEVETVVARTRVKAGSGA